MIPSSRLLFGAAAGLLAMSLMAVSAKPAAAQAADAEARCTGDVMRLCSEFVPDADSIVVCLKAKRAHLEPSCLNALSPAPPAALALQAPPKQISPKRVSPKKTEGKAGAPLVLVPAAYSTGIRDRATAAR